MHLFTYKPDIRKIVLSPMPRYWVGKCCSDAEHIPNFFHQDYERTMFDGLANLRRTIKDYLFLHNATNIKVVNPFLVFGGASGRNIADDVIASVRTMWVDDPVHPSYDCIDRLASFLSGELMPEDGSEAVSTTTGGRPPAPPAKRLRSATEQPPTFITPRTRGAGPRGRGRPWSYRGCGRGYRGQQ
jgi:hypothetical protein